jgi:GTP-binding protein
MILDEGRALVVAVNKWDGLSADQKAWNHKELDRRLDFVPWVHVQPISALHGTGVGDLYPPIHRAWVSAFPDAGTNQLNRILRKLVDAHQPPLVGRHRIKLRYAHPGGTNPPVIVVHGNQAEAVPGPYRRYLENGFREALKLEGTPLRVELRGGDNPYAHKPNPLSARQLRRRRRLMRHVKR